MGDVGDELMQGCKALAYYLLNMVICGGVMCLMQSFFDLVVALIPAFVTLFIFSRGFRGEYDRERYEKIVFPAFTILEPHLYRPIDSEVEFLIREVLVLIETNRKISGGNLWEYAEPCKFNLTQVRYNNLCEAIDRDHTRLCRRLGIPARSFDYKVRKRQMRGVLTYIWYYAMIVIALAISVTYCVYLIFELWQFVQMLFQ